MSFLRTCANVFLFTISLIFIDPRTPVHGHFTNIGDFLPPQQSNNKDVAKSLLNSMGLVFGQSKMKMAFANGVFADGVLKILHDIQHQHLSAKLSQNYGDMNVKILVFWAKLYALSTTQFKKVQKNLLDLKDIEKCVELAIEERKSAKKAELLSLADFMITSSTTVDVQGLLNNFLTEVNLQPPELQSEENQAYAESTDDAQFWVDNRFVPSPQTYQHMNELFEDPGECAFVALYKEQAYFLSGGLFGECWVFGDVYELNDYVQHGMLWSFELLSEDNVVHSDARRRRRRALLNQCSSDSPLNPPFVITFVIKSKKPPFKQIELRTEFSLLNGIRSELVLGGNGGSSNAQQLNNGRVKVSDPLVFFTAEQSAQMLHEVTSNMVQFLVDFKSGTPGIYIHYYANEEAVRLKLYDIELNFGGAQHSGLDATAYQFYLKVSMGMDTGLIALQKSPYSTEPIPLASIEIPAIDSEEWTAFTNSDRIENVIVPGSETSENVNTIIGGDHIPQHIASNGKTVGAYFVNYNGIAAVDIDMEAVWITKSEWVSRGFDSHSLFSWPIALFSFGGDSAMPGAPVFNAEFGFEFVNESGQITRVTYNTFNGMRFVYLLSDSVPTKIDVEVNGDYVGADFDSDDDDNTVDPLAAHLIRVFDLEALFPNPQWLDFLNENATSDWYWNTTQAQWRSFELVLDIGDQKTGLISLNTTWRDPRAVGPHFADAQKNIPLFEIDLDCKGFGFRPVFTATGTGSAVMFLDNGDGHHHHEDDAEPAPAHPPLNTDDLNQFLSAFPLTFDLPLTEDFALSSMEWANQNASAVTNLDNENQTVSNSAQYFAVDRSTLSRPTHDGGVVHVFYNQPSDANANARWPLSTMVRFAFEQSYASGNSSARALAAAGYGAGVNPVCYIAFRDNGTLAINPTDMSTVSNNNVDKDTEQFTVTIRAEAYAPTAISAIFIERDDSGVQEEITGFTGVTVYDELIFICEQTSAVTNDVSTTDFSLTLIEKQLLYINIGPTPSP